ncbi:metallophosphoesterase [Marinifilum sp. RC60d5]|uniref:metallophosphoesterase n=1 Tax=Marinifilum sp. RC60d5 TaxID=3458414 RepID=UPI0040368C42
MKQSMMIIFMAIIILVFGTVAWYIYSRCALALEGNRMLSVFTWAFWFLIATFFVGQILERGEPGVMATLISRTGSVGLAFFLYMLLFVLFVDFVRVFQHYFHFIPTSLTSGILSGKMLFIYGISLSTIITIGGFINAHNPIVKEIDLEISKKNSKRDSLKVLLATDVHLGVMLGKNHAQKLVRQINAQKPDIVLFGGDLVDHNPSPVMKYDMGTYIEKINAPLGVYAVTGNHEFMGKPDVTIDYFTKHGITYIRDSIVDIDGIVQILGRDDKDKSQFTQENRKNMDEIMNNSNANLPLLLVDHQPVEYDKASENGVDLMMSGHTHKGQLWPLSFVTNLVYENDFGLMKKANTWFYTSSGYGTWGPPVRTGNRPELVVFNLSLKNN